MKTYLFVLTMLLGLSVSAQHPVIKENMMYRKELNSKYVNPETSPLKKEDIPKFGGLPFFNIDTNYAVIARLVLDTVDAPFEMKTTTDRLPVYDLYAVAYFELNGEEFKLNLYRGQKLKKKDEYYDYLFVPFTDLTNGEETYGGGRYLDLPIPAGELITLDFNKAYNPYCFYNKKYSCPIPPKENFLDIRIEAGVKAQM